MAALQNRNGSYRIFYEKSDLAGRNPDRVAHLHDVLRRQQALDREPPPADPAGAGG